MAKPGVSVCSNWLPNTDGKPQGGFSRTQDLALFSAPQLKAWQMAMVQ